ncbi:hypothetical protein PHLCEN_2v1801 [Hermanssonia centrifuga]|uniref:Uncharacterized protein n=1 Tax=Hermanssonia centrifuga TaxID=98765 RepID=A0A2R6RVV4_9APHY|nr:hypothetical protein PHLCEN_2v1801 [Hermanssonia centrifuga]
MEARLLTLRTLLADHVGVKLSEEEEPRALASELGPSIAAFLSQHCYKVSNLNTSKSCRITLCLSMRPQFCLFWNHWAGPGSMIVLFKNP